MQRHVGCSTGGRPVPHGRGPTHTPRCSLSPSRQALALPPPDASSWLFLRIWTDDRGPAATPVVRTSSEIPLPSPSLYSSSGQGTAAIWTSTRPPFRGLGEPWPLSASCTKRGHSAARVTPEPQSDHQRPRDIDQLGSLAGAARLLQDNAGVPKQCSDGTEISQGGEGQRCC